jgi:hypothetical protein
MEYSSTILVRRLRPSKIAGMPNAAAATIPATVIPIAIAAVRPSDERHVRAASVKPRRSDLTPRLRRRARVHGRNTRPGGPRE